MWVPFANLCNAFEDPLTELDCRRYVQYVQITRATQLVVAPNLVALALAGGGFAVVALAYHFGWFPVPFMRSDYFWWYHGIAAVVAFIVAKLLVRDFLIYLGVRAEINRVRCPHCRHSLQGLRIDEVGTGLDPTMRFVRCVECGRRHRLIDLGLTPMDLVPFEQRIVPENFARRRA
jgi:DNA-directed RNA polymerase subunit RPC12/RpoP